MSSPHHEYPRGPRLSLREFRPDDLLAWQRIAGDPRVAAHTPWPALATPDTAGAWLAETARMAQAKPRRSFYLGVEQYGDLIGTATLDILSFPHRQGEIGLYLRPDRWAEGLGTETARLLLELAFSRLELHRVQATFDPRNLPGLRVAEHVKMRPEGILLDRYLIAGQWQDRAMYAITLPEWRGLGRQPNVTFEGAGEEPLIGAPREEDGVAADASDGLGAGSDAAADAVPVQEVPVQGAPVQAGESVTADDVFAEHKPSGSGASGGWSGGRGAENTAQDAESFGGFGSSDDSGSGSDDFDSDSDSDDFEPQVLTAQIVTKQIEVVEILPRDL